MEAVPRRKIEYKGTIFEEMDVDAIIARKPAVVLVDELAHTNIPGSKHRKALRGRAGNSAGQDRRAFDHEHPASRKRCADGAFDHGNHRAETVADWVPGWLATETVMVDLTPEALLQNRLKRGDVYSTEKVEQALGNFFRAGNLIALRELALRQVAEHVDRSLGSYMDAKAIER